MSACDGHTTEPRNAGSGERGVDERGTEREDEAGDERDVAMY